VFPYSRSVLPCSHGFRSSGTHLIGDLRKMFVLCQNLPERLKLRRFEPRDGVWRANLPKCDISEAGARVRQPTLSLRDRN
jgi:hypothetical protein